MQSHSVEHVGVSELRKLNAEKLRNLDKMLLIEHHSAPLAVIIRYDLYLKVQEQLMEALSIAGQCPW